jgi:hypothetical protein
LKIGKTIQDDGCCDTAAQEKARKLSPAALEQPYRALGAMLQLSCSIVTGLLEKVYGRPGKNPIMAYLETVSLFICCR